MTTSSTTPSTSTLKSFVFGFLTGWDEPPRAHRRLVRLYLTALGLVYLAAFGSLGVQWRGLIGSHGLTPVSDVLGYLPSWAGPFRFLFVPTLLWISSSDPAIAFLVWGGVGLSALLIFGIAPRWVSALLWLFWLSLVNASDVFLGYQWESLLLEAGFLAPFLARRGEPSATFLFLHRWLLFRLLFASGVGKLMSGDPTWRDLSALQYHFETQPLPNAIAWYAHQLPGAFLKVSTLVMFVIEIAVPFLFFLPRRLRLFAFFAEVALQLGILATGNFAYFNWLTIALCLLLLDDDALLRLPERMRRFLDPGEREGRTGSRVASGIAGGMIFLLSVSSFLNVDFARGFRLVSRYGLFVVMTTERPELVIEGSRDKIEWKEYELPFKPGDPKRRPPFVAPHQPRLDWQLWFAAMSRFEGEEWLQRLMLALLRNERDVLGLFARNPFSDAPPKYVRILRYRYRFTDWAERRRSGAWWRRELVDAYTPILSLK